MRLLGTEPLANRNGSAAEASNLMECCVKIVETLATLSIVETLVHTALLIKAAIATQAAEYATE